MTRPGRVLGLILCATLILAALAWVAFWWVFSSKVVPSNIVDFRPQAFEAKASTKFFYSIADDLKYSDEVAVQSQTLLHGHIGNFLVSPDSREIAVVANGMLSIVNPEGPTVKQVARTDSIYSESKPLGRQFFRDQDFQWAKDSKSLYLIKDEFYESKGSQLYSQKGELWQYETQTGELHVVLKPFPSYDYFFGTKGIYFSVPTAEGNLQLEYFDGSTVRAVGDVNAAVVYVEKQPPDYDESIFYSFSSIDFNQLYAQGAYLSVEKKGGPMALTIGSKLYLSITPGNGFKGTFFCSDLYHSVFLPGRRYFVFSVPYCGNYNGQLLVDTETGMYQKLPKDTAVYLTYNTNTVQNYHASSGGMMAN